MAAARTTASPRGLPSVLPRRDEETVVRVQPVELGAAGAAGAAGAGAAEPMGPNGWARATQGVVEVTA
ncbi:hypothetical protein GCM10023168_29920 [Fodinibacter luteus]|uniref:Uncharacterized protein n=1 Tax=Fodinibacter luteus TaxID=552064 RepID=A0ABP8KLS6_9MICO